MGLHTGRAGRDVAKGGCASQFPVLLQRGSHQRPRARAGRWAAARAPGLGLGVCGAATKVPEEGPRGVPPGYVEKNTLPFGSKGEMSPRPTEEKRINFHL